MCKRGAEAGMPAVRSDAQGLEGRSRKGRWCRLRSQLPWDRKDEGAEAATKYVQPSPLHSQPAD